jgi:proline iminopeptidase
LLRELNIHAYLKNAILHFKNCAVNLINKNTQKIGANMPYANIGDAKIYYEIYGNELDLTDDGVCEKPSLVVLHGGPGIDHTFEVEFSRECAPFAQVILIDHRGNGRSIDSNPDHWNLTQWAKDVYLFCETLGLKKPFIQGVSTGGWVTIQFAITYPDYASGIILLDTEAYVDLERICAAYEKRGGKEISEIARKFFQKEQAPPEIIEEYFKKCLPLCSNNPIPAVYFKRAILRPEVGAHLQKERATFNYMGDLRRIKTPVLYLTNTTNPSHLFEVAKETAAAMINAEVNFVPFENCGIVQHDAKEQGINEIKKFLQQYYLSEKNYGY